MGRRPGLTLERRQMAIGMLAAEMSVRDVARHFGVTERTMSNLKRKFRETGTVKDRPRSGRPRKTTPAEDRYIVTSSRRNRFLTGTQLAVQLRNARGTIVSDQTVRNRLHAARLRARRPYVGIPLTRRHRQDRVNWATAHQRWVRRQWNEVLFTDESRFNIQFADGRVRVWRLPGERFHQANVIERDRFGGGSVMVWGGISNRAKTDLVTIGGTLTSVRYCDEVIEPVVVPFLRQRHATIFQHDNARPHTANNTKDLLRQNNVNVLDWPSKSPDLSPIEHLWDNLGVKVRQRNDVNNVRDLERALHEEWANITMAEVRKLIGSMRKRCLAVIESRGGHNRY